MLFVAGSGDKMRELIQSNATNMVEVVQHAGGMSVRFGGGIMICQCGSTCRCDSTCRRHVRTSGGASRIWRGFNLGMPLAFFIKNVIIT